MSKPFEAVYGSAVMPVVKAIVDPDWLLDELELRLTRCNVPDATASGRVRMGAILPAGEQLHRVASAETRSWWNEHGLTELDSQRHRQILDALLERSPRYLSWCTVPLVAGQWESLLDAAMVMRVVDWVADANSVDCVVRDAVALSLVLPWLNRQSEGEARDVLIGLCRSEVSARLRLGLLAAAAYVRDRQGLAPDLERAVLDICWAQARRVDPETALAVGWVLRELIGRDKERLVPELLARVQGLSRQAMRTAVERLPVPMRQRVTAKWLRRPRLPGDPIALTCKPRPASRAKR